MLSTPRIAVDQAGEEIQLIEIRTSSNPINFRERPVVFGPFGDPLIDNGNGTYRSTDGACYRVID